MKRTVTIIMNEDAAYQLMGLLGMQSEKRILDAWNETKESYSDCAICRVEDDYPRFDPKSTSIMVDKLFSKLYDELQPWNNITISI